MLDCTIPAGILVVSPFPDDHRFLRDALLGTAASFGRALNLRQAIEQLRHRRTAVVVTERDLPDATWRDVPSLLAPLSPQPLLIVASRIPDEYLWAEVLNTCGFDILAKPFARDETVRVLRHALSHYQASLQGARPLHMIRSSAIGAG